jgi:hypothetical protein
MPTRVTDFKLSVLHSHGGNAMPIRHVANHLKYAKLVQECCYFW